MTAMTGLEVSFRVCRRDRGSPNSTLSATRELVLCDCSSRHEYSARPLTVLVPHVETMSRTAQEEHSGDWIDDMTEQRIRYRIAAKYSNTLTFKHVLAPLDISNSAGRKHSNIK